MQETRKYSGKKIMKASLWTLLAIGGVVLLVSALNKRDSEVCKGININLNGNGNFIFIDSIDIVNIIRSKEGNDFIGKSIRKFDVGVTEKELLKDVWVNKAELYFDNNGILTADITERKPVARIFTTGGNSFYIDEEKKMLPLSDRHAARLPMFSNFPSDQKVLSKADSALLDDIKSLSIYIQNDDFLMAMIDQIAINSDRQFEMVPKIGDQIIVFGDASEIENKFNKLKLFYSKVMSLAGWNKYNKIDLQFKGQIVARVKAKQDVAADSIHTMQMMKALAEVSMKMASDSIGNNIQKSDSLMSDISEILQSSERDEQEQAETAGNVVSKRNVINTQPLKNPGNSISIVKKPVQNPAVKKVMPQSQTNQKTKPAVKPKPATTVKPKTNKVIPKKNK